MIYSPRGRRGSHLLIRSPRAGDEREFTALVAASSQLHLGWVSPPADARRFAAYLRRGQEPDFEPLLLIRRKDRVILGAVSLSEIVYGAFQSAYLGYWIGAPYARQGYMREGLGLVLDHAFQTLKLHRLEANIQPANAASKRLVQGLGFRLEGFSPKYLKIGARWRDHERWAILREQWQARPRTGPQSRQ